MDRELTAKEIEHVTNEIKAGAGSGQLSAIKLYRKYSRKGLRESKEFVETLIAELQKQEPERFAHLTRNAGKGCAPVILAFLVSVGCICASIAADEKRPPSADRVDVVLTAVPTKGKVPIVKIIRESSGKSLHDILQLMKDLPSVVCTNLPLEHAQTLTNRLAKVSAKTQLQPHDTNAQQIGAR
jgi:ribosomal protein L7/L12